jgi:hypothetical protein
MPSSAQSCGRRAQAEAVTATWQYDAMHGDA